ncbi:MAG: tetratricopeptide (TPR) repeat protein [Planctomycetota bacterium]|jgi:tetratricopeptide (TPR) repeat protein
MQAISLLVLCTFFMLPAAPPVLAQGDPGIEAILGEERAEADLLRRRGKVREALRLLSEHLKDEPGDAASRELRARCRLDMAHYEQALSDAERARVDSLANEDPRELIAACVRTEIDVLLALGRSADALVRWDEARDAMSPTLEARDAWSLGRLLAAGGDREGSRLAWEGGVTTPDEQSWQALLARAACERAVGRLTLASKTVVLADRLAQKQSGVEPDVLVALADLYFESEREIDSQSKRSASALYKDARRIHETHEGALLGLFELHRFNRRRRSETPEEILAQLLDPKPDHIDGLIARAAADIDDGKLPKARTGLRRLDELAPARREVRTLLATLAWVEHRRDDCRAILDELATVAPDDGRPEREIGRHLIELYRFSEAVPFLKAAVERDPTDHQAWTRLGGALANAGDEEAALEAFRKAESAASGRRDAWRENMMMVLERMDREQVKHDAGELQFQWMPDAADVLMTYLVPFYHEARTEFAERYGHTPSKTKIEVFRRHEDFSVRSVGFQGFPALGVCFGPVVTSLSPLSAMRGNFSWARTAFHEFSHVIHLGLSHNRCPRWITEGLATWEEVNKRPMWTRNMRRELVDAFYNDNLIRVRDLNRAFRGPRIIFGYYEGGLLCEMLIEKHGFAPMIHILEAFDRGLDLDQAFAEVFHTTPEAIDDAFNDRVASIVSELEIEPRWDPTRVRRSRLGLSETPPDDAELREAWAEKWLTIGWGSWQQGRRLDAEQALRHLKAADIERPRLLFLRGEMALTDKKRTLAQRLWTDAIDAGGRDYRALIGLGSLHAIDGNDDKAEEFYEMAELAFPGYDQPDFSAELRLVEMHLERGDEDAAMRARERWLAWNAGEFDLRMLVASWHGEKGRFAEAAALYAEANEVDPFRRRHHLDWAEALFEIQAYEEADREWTVAALVPIQLDADEPQAATPSQRAKWLCRRASCAVALDAPERAAELAKEALQLDPSCDQAQAFIR